MRLDEPVVDGKALTNSPNLLGAGIEAAKAADNAAQTGNNLAHVEVFVGDDPNMCLYIHLPKQTTLSPYLACGGVFKEDDGAGPYAIWVVPFRVNGTAASAVGTVSGPAEKAALAYGTKLWRPDGYVGDITNDGYGNMQSKFRLSLSGPPGVRLLLTLAAYGDLLVITVIVFSLLWSRWRPHQAPRPDQASADLWQPVVALAFAPAIKPPTPVLIEHKPRPSLTALQPAGSSMPPGDALDVVDGVGTGGEETGPNLETEPSITEPSIDVIGPVVHAGWAIEPTRRLVVEAAAYLATHKERPVPAERLRTALWPYDPGRGDVALARVHEQISRLRRCLGADHLPEAVGGYQLSETVRCDWAQFEALVEASRAVPEAGSIDFLAQALALVRGQPFADVPAKTYGWAWDELLVPHMEAATTDAAHIMASRCLAAGRPTDAAWAARQGLMAVPKDERLLEDSLQGGAVEGRAALDRAWRGVQGALGPEAEQGPLFLRYTQLRENCRPEVLS